MARLFLILATVLVIVAFVSILVSIWNAAVTTTRHGLRKYAGIGKDSIMAPTGFQKAAFIALIVVLFGIASGWLGGL